MPRKRYDTPHRSRVVKTRMTEEEYADFAARLAALGKLTAEYGRIGNNLNQIARTLNDWHNPYPQLAAEVRAAASDLAALKFEVLEKVGEAVGNVQTYQL